MKPIGPEHQGPPIKSLRDLREAASAKRSVFSRWGCVAQRPLPAVVVLNMSGTVIHNLLERGLFIYEKKAKQPPTEKEPSQ